MKTILVEYETRFAELQTGWAQIRMQHAASAIVLMAAVGLFLTLGLHAIRQRVPLWWLLPIIPVAAVSAQFYKRYGAAHTRTRRLQRFYGAAIERVKGLWPGQGFSGEEFDDGAHIYAGDLAIFGEGSLFELLCTARTAIGRRGLANYLLKAPALDETLARQEAVRELEPQIGLREQAAVLGESDFLESKWETFEEWLKTTPAPFHKAFRATALVTSMLVAGIALGAMSGLLPWIQAAIWISPLAVFHAAAGLALRDRVNCIARSAGALPAETQVLREGLRLLETQRFRSPKLIRITERVANGSRAVRKLERLLGALNERNKEWFYLPSLMLLGGTQLCMAIEQWRVEHGGALRGWLDAWGEFEALNALATYAHENRRNPFPEFSEGGARFEALELGHPLLAEETCVRNDVALNDANRFYVISGSNMSGKSTLMRAIGLNAVLAFAGAPVRAQALRLSELSVCASLSVVDSLLNGKSRFLAEVDRLRQTIESADGDKAVLFLVDEIFSGTNSRDRRVAAEAVVRTLVNRGAVGALSTHDISLTEIADSEGLSGVNVHMGSKDGSDPMDFDYKLKPGITMEANALAIARMAGVPV